MTSRVYMDMNEVQKMAESYRQRAQLLRYIDTSLLALIQIMRCIAFVGQVGDRLYVSYLEQHQPQIRFLSQQLDEVAEDIERAVQLYRDF